MATATLQRHGFAEGTSVSAWPAQNSVNGGPPAGSSVATATVTSGVLTFTGLTVGVKYVAYAAGRGVQFRADEALGVDSAAPEAPERTRIDYTEAAIGGDAVGLVNARVDAAVAAATALDSRTTAVEGRATAVEGRTLSGTGSPEGVVTANKGSIYQQTDGSQASTGNSATWIKETGTGNTGWRKLRTTIPIYLDLFGPRGGGGLSLPAGQATYAFATAVTASTKLLPAYLTGRVIEANYTVVWTPNDVDNGIKLISMDSVTGGVPDNPTDIQEFTGLATATPVNSGAFITTSIAAIWDGTAARYLGWQFKSDAVNQPVLYWIGLYVAVEV